MGLRATNRNTVLGAALHAERHRQLRAFIYARVSRDPRRRDTSIRDQLTENRHTCAEHGWIVVGEFSDPDRSASRHAKRARPEWDDMLAKAETGDCDVIVFWESSRGYRDLSVFVRLRELCLRNNILLCYDGEIFDVSKYSDWKRLTRDAVDAENEAEKIRERVLRTTRLSAERGDIHGKIPYGFRREYDPKSGDLLRQVADEDTSTVVKEAAKRIAAGETTYAIAKSFQARGVVAPRNAKRGWDLTTVSQIVLNPAIIGKRAYRGEIVGDAVWDGFLDEVTYYTCRKILTDPARRKQRDSAVSHLLSGIAVAPCGQVLRVRRNRKQLSYTCVRDFCCAMEIAKFEQYVEIAFLEYVSRPEFRRALTEDDGSGRLQEAMALAVQLESELEEARALVGKRQLSVASLASIEQQLAPQIAAARAQAQESAVPEVLSMLATVEAPQVWASLGLPQKRAALRAAVKITLNRARAAGVRSIEPGRITLEWIR